MDTEQNGAVTAERIADVEALLAAAQAKYAALVLDLGLRAGETKLLHGRRITGIVLPTPITPVDAIQVVAC